jgi:23S rRNA G2069 N7-methylase RlmK/C1962 C5-methylase RlmI
VVLASTNAARLEPADFVAELGAASRSAGRKLVRSFYVPQPPDFPITRAEPGYLKTVWLQFD